MERNTTQQLNSYWANIPRQNLDYLAQIRTWSNVQIAIEEKYIWLKGFSENQIDSKELILIPGLILYKNIGGNLFKKNSLLPTQTIRTGLIWTAITNAIPVVFKPENHNFFHVEKKLTFQFKKIDDEKKSNAILIDFISFRNEIESMPPFKCEKYNWVIVNEKALFIGEPILALPGQSYWIEGNHIIPSGYNFEFSDLSKLAQKKIDTTNENWILWNIENEFILIPKIKLNQFSLSSFRLTIKNQLWEL